MTNLVIITGYVGRDAELRMTPTGTPVATFSVASNMGTKEKPVTVWFRVTCWRRLAEIAGEYVKKGGLVQVEARFDQAPRIWSDRRGEPQASLEVTAQNFRLLGPKQEQAGEVSVTDAQEIPW